jgi:ABC-2 type transport system ATP-binding protein
MVRDLIVDLSRREEMTVFLNSHHLDEVQRICSTVAILAGGRIQAFDSVRNLIAASDRPEMTVVLAEPGERARACETAIALPYVSDCEDEGEVLRCTLTDPGVIPDFIAALVAAGFRLLEVRRSSRSLEEIYLEHVGQSGDGA